MSEMLDMILDSTERMFKDYSTKDLIDLSEQGEWASELWGILAESGILHVGIPEELDGAGGDYIDAFNILRLAGKYAVPLPIAETLITQWLLAQQGVKPSIEPITLSFQENNALTIKENEVSFTINGSIVGVPWARHAKKLLISGKRDGKNVMLLLPLEKAVIQPGENLAKEPRDTVVFENIIIDKVPCYPIDERAMLNKVTEMGALARSAMIAGAMEQILELTVFYTNERKQFGRPLHRFQAIQHHLSSLAGETVASLAAFNCALPEFEKSEKEVALTKMKLGEAAGKVAEIAHQVHGAIGVTHEHALHHYTRRLWSWRDEYGNERYWAAKLANILMENKDNTLWEIMTERKQPKLVYQEEK